MQTGKQFQPLHTEREEDQGGQETTQKNVPGTACICFVMCVTVEVPYGEITDNDVGKLDILYAPGLTLHFPWAHCECI